MLGFSGSGAELCDKRWFGFEIEHLLTARLFRIQYQNQYLCLLEIITADINIVQWVSFEFYTPIHFSFLGPQHPCKHLIATHFNWKVSPGHTSMASNVPKKNVTRQNGLGEGQKYYFA